MAGAGGVGCGGVPKAAPPRTKTTSSEPVKPLSAVSENAVKPHGNSAEYVGETHVYVIRDVELGTVHKVGESMQGLKKDGLSKRAEAQAQKLFKETGRRFEKEIRREFSTKAEARSHETGMIQTTRKFFGDDKLPGNKGKH